MRLHHFKILAPYTDRVGHAVTTREGGVSRPPYHSLNLAYHVGDKKEHVDRNHELLAEAMGYDVRQIVHMRQVHGNQVFRVDADYDYTFVPECDALITDRVDMPLMVMVADCIPILLFDPEHNAVAAVHAGRSGLFKGVIPATADAMRRAYGTRPDKLLACLGGSIHACCYEVGDEIVDEANRLGFGFAVEKREGSWYLDNVAIAEKQLEMIGVKKENIEMMEVCTGCQNDTLFSYRKENRTTGRFAGVIFLRS